jgi:hypothetical protein
VAWDYLYLLPEKSLQGFTIRKMSPALRWSLLEVFSVQTHSHNKVKILPKEKKHVPKIIKLKIWRPGRHSSQSDA